MNTYDFYRFSRLVNDLIIKKYNMDIPYDLEYSDVLKSYEGFNYTDNCVDPYQEQVIYILNDLILLHNLQAHNDGY